MLLHYASLRTSQNMMLEDGRCLIVFGMVDVERIYESWISSTLQFAV